jgi:hypothetical protein
MIESVKDAYTNYPAERLNRIWLSHQQAMIQTMLSRGNNVYKLSHMKKEKLIRDGHLPPYLCVSVELYNDCKQYCLENGYVV